MTSQINVPVDFLYEKQKRVFFGPEKVVYCIGATKSGKSLGGLVWLLSEAVKCKDGQKVAWFSLTKNNSRDFFERLTTMLKDWDSGLWSANKVQQEVYIKGSGTIKFMSTDNDDTIYGSEFYAVLLDEASRVSEESREAIMSTIFQTKGKIRMVGNALDRKNWFQDEFNAIIAYPEEWPEKDYLAIKLTCFDALAGGVIDTESLEDARRRYRNNKKKFRLLYLCDTKITGDANPFGHDNIEKCLINGLSPDPAVCYGLDLGSMDDFTVLTGIDALGRVCVLERFKDSYVKQEEIILSIVTDAPCMVEKTGVGAAVYDHLRHEQPHLFYGVSTNKLTKGQFIQELSIAFSKGDIAIPKNTELHEEIKLFERNESNSSDYVTYSAPAGAHDDCVMSLALCIWMRKELRGHNKVFRKAKVHNVKSRVPKFTW